MAKKVTPNPLLPGKTELKKQWERLNVANFNAFVNAIENDVDLELSDEYDYDIDPKNLIVTINTNWTDEGNTGDYECSTKITFDFKTGKIKQSGECENESIEVPGPGYMVGWNYSQEQDSSFDPKNYKTVDDFNRLLTDFVEDYGSLFSQFAQRDGEEQAEIDYCPTCGSPEDECEKCDNCGECVNNCECDEGYSTGAEDELNEFGNKYLSDLEWDVEKDEGWFLWIDLSNIIKYKYAELIIQKEGNLYVLSYNRTDYPDIYKGKLDNQMYNKIKEEISNWKGPMKPYKANEEAMGGASGPMSTLNNTPGMGNAVPPQQNTTGSGDKWSADSSLGPYTQGKVEEGWGKNIAAGAMLGAASLMPMHAQTHKSNVDSDNKPRIERQINKRQKEYEIAVQEYEQFKKENPNYDADKKIYAELMQWKKRIEDQSTYKFGDKIQAESFYPSLDIVVNEESISPYDKIGSMMAKKMGVPLNFKKGKNTSASEVHQVNVEKPKNPKYKVKSKVKTKKINESYRLSGVTYDIHPGPEGKIFAGQEGILGHSEVLIPWDIVKNLLSKYSH